MRSLGTGVMSLKFFENFLRSFSFTALSCDALLRLLSWTLIFSTARNCRNESRTSCSTFSVTPGRPSCFGGALPSLVAAAAAGWGFCSAFGAAALPSSFASPFGSGFGSAFVSGFCSAAFSPLGSSFALADPGRAICDEMMAGSMKDSFPAAGPCCLRAGG